MGLFFIIFSYFYFNVCIGVVLYICLIIFELFTGYYKRYINIHIIPRYNTRRRHYNTITTIEQTA